MPSTSIDRNVGRYRRALRESRVTGCDPDESFGEAEATYRARLADSLDRSAEREPDRERVLDAMSRRDFLRTGAILTAGVTAAGLTGSRRARAAAPRVVVVGAGFAGLTAAWKIHAVKGWPVQVFEARDRVSGRVHTIRMLAGGQYSEAGGSGISSNQDEIRTMCERLGLWPLVDTWLRYPAGSESYWLAGAPRTWTDIKPAVTAIANASWDAWVAIGRRIPTKASHNTAALTYDEMTVADFITGEAGVPLSSVGGRYIASFFGGEYGGRIDQASALHQILEEGTFWDKGGYDERWAVPGGNDVLATTLTRRLPAGSVRLGHELVAIRARTDGSIRLTFRHGGALRDVVADRVVLAIPPTTLRKVDTAGAGFDAAKRRAIQQEAMGSGAKGTIQFASRPWKDAGLSGDAVTDLTPAEMWQTSYLAAAPASLMFLNNRAYPHAAAHGKMPGSVRREALADLDRLFPGCTAAAIDGQAHLDNWPRDPWVKGTYSHYPPGGFTSFGGVQARRIGRISFAGEHTADYDERGTMCGAVESGLRAAREVMGLG